MNLLAIDTSTEWMSLAVQRGDSSQCWLHHAAGGARTSHTLIPQIMTLLAQAQLQLSALDAIVIGAGPGAFTGLRSACAVAQGLAFGAGVAVLPIDTLLAVAEEAREVLKPAGRLEVIALLDARMDEMYAGHYRYEGNQWTSLKACSLVSPEDLAQYTDAPEAVLAGNVFEVYGTRLAAASAQRLHALPSATALLRLAPAGLAAGHAVPAARALPTYVRDKVAQTTAERMAHRLAATP